MWMSLYVLVSVGVVRAVRPVRDDIQASFWRPSKAKKREIDRRAEARVTSRELRVRPSRSLVVQVLDGVLECDERGLDLGHGLGLHAPHLGHLVEQLA